MDVNPESLQMALALSKSTFEVENPQSKGDISSPPNSLKNTKISSVLERFGFKSDTLKLESFRPETSSKSEVCI